MRVQRVLMPDADTESWTVLGDDHVPVEPVERFLAYLAAIEKSPNTVKAYAHDLKDWFTYLAGRGGDWRTASLEEVAGFVAWLRLPPPARDGRVAVLPTVGHHCAESSVNRKLAALGSFYEFHARHEADLGAVVTMRPPGRGAATSYKPFLHHVTKGGSQRSRTIKLRQPKNHPDVLTAKQVQAILDACEHPPPAAQRASDASLLRRLEAATDRIARLEAENLELRDQLARALGQQRAAAVSGPLTSAGHPQADGYRKGASR